MNEQWEQVDYGGTWRRGGSSGSRLTTEGPGGGEEAVIEAGGKPGEERKQLVGWQRGKLFFRGRSESGTSEVGVGRLGRRMELGQEAKGEGGCAEEERGRSRANW